MKAIIQRVFKASVEVDQKKVGAINEGLLIFIGIAHQDTVNDSKWLANKIYNLRIFPNSQGKFDHSLIEMGGACLIISQFTLCADCSSGRRPSFIQAANEEAAIPLYQHFIEEFRLKKIFVQTGIFGANMKVSLVNDGPVTLILETCTVPPESTRRQSLPMPMNSSGFL